MHHQASPSVESVIVPSSSHKQGLDFCEYRSSHDGLMNNQSVLALMRYNHTTKRPVSLLVFYLPKGKIYKKNFTPLDLARAMHACMSRRSTALPYCLVFPAAASCSSFSCTPFSLFRERGREKASKTTTSAAAVVIFE